MRIGILFRHGKIGGGIYQYFLSIMDSLARCNREDEIFLFHTQNIERLPAYREAGIRTIQLDNGESYSGQLPSAGGLNPAYDAIHNNKRIKFRTKSLTQELRAEISKHNIDMMVYPAPERESFEVGVPYVIAIHDIAHRLLPQFKEFSADGIYEQREYVYTNGINKACVILADSEVGKRQLIDCYNIEPTKIKILPFAASSYLLKEIDAYMMGRLKVSYRLPDRFVFYPAQFWPHKNHENIIRAIFLIKQNKGERFPAVFVGSKQERWDGFERVQRLANQLKIEDLIVYLGYVPSAHMRALYELAIALVMPTFLGPTNIPILEAFAVGCPVIASDISGVKEQLGDAGILVDPNSPEEIAEAIHRVGMDEALRDELIRKGHKKANGWTSSEFSVRFMEIVDSCKKGLEECRPSHSNAFPTLSK